MSSRTMKLLWLNWWTWKDTLAAAGGVTAILVLLEKVKVFGISVYKGAGFIWKFVMRAAIYRKEMENRHTVLYGMVKDILDQTAQLKEEIAAVKKQVYYNGGKSLPDGQKRIESAVLQMDARQNIADIANDRMTFRMDKEGALVEINEVFLKKFGYDENDVKGFAYESLVHEDDVIEMRSKWNRAITQKSRFYDEQRICDSKRVYHLCAVRGHPIINGGDLLGFTGFIEIINEK